MRRNDAPGLLVSFSGIDGVGKTTQIEMLQEKLSHDGLKCVSKRFSLDDFGQKAQASVNNLLEAAHVDWVFTRLAPDFDERVPLVRSLVYDPVLQAGRNGAAATMMFAGGCLQIYENCIAKLLDGGANVVCDRYWIDELVFRAQWVEEATLLSLYKDMPVPDVAFYFDADPNLIYERNLDRKDGSSPFMQSLDKIAELRRRFLDLSERYAIYLIDANLSKEEMHAAVLSIVDRKRREVLT